MRSCRLPPPRSCCSPRTPPTTTSPVCCSCSHVTFRRPGCSCGSATASPSPTASSCSRVAAGAIYVAFGGRTAPLIPLYAVGVFLAFTLSQARHGRPLVAAARSPLARSLAFSATGGSLSAIVFVTAAITKFTEGAWVALLAIGLFILARDCASAPTTSSSPRRPPCTRTRSRSQHRIVPVRTAPRPPASAAARTPRSDGRRRRDRGESR